jgi:hypothetical protein
MRLGGGEAEMSIHVYPSTYSEAGIQSLLHNAICAIERRPYHTCLVAIFLAGFTVFLCEEHSSVTVSALSTFTSGVSV